MAQVTRFEEFELLIGAASRTGVYPVQVIGGMAGEAEGTLCLDPNSPDIQSAIGGIVDRTITRDQLRQFGSQLFEALFAGRIGSKYRTVLGRVQSAGTQLQLRLRMSPPEISALPWEYLYDPESKLAIAISSDHCLSRYLASNEPVRPTEIEPPLRLLIVVSDPSNLSDYGLPRLEADKEIKHIQEALGELASKVETDILSHAVASELRDKLRRFRPHIVHFIGHGGFEGNQGMLMIETPDHRARLINDEDLGDFFLNAQDARLVVLNACNGATQSSTRALAGLAPHLVQRGLGAVVAMQYPIPDAVSLSFAREFYRALAQYYSVDAAVAEGRRAIKLDFGSDQPDWGTPVIFMRSPDGRLFGAPEVKHVTMPAPLMSQAINTGRVGAHSQGAPFNVSDVSTAGSHIEQPASQSDGQLPSSAQADTGTPKTRSEETTMPATNSSQYDVFISYSHRDEEWVQGWLLRQLEAAGLRVFIDFRDFEPGAPNLTEMERGVSQSRKTVLALTPDYLRSEWTEFEALLVQTSDPAARRRRILPLLLKPCELPARISMLNYLDFTRADRVDLQLQRLIAAIRSESMPTSWPATTSGPSASPLPQPETSRIRDALAKQFGLDEFKDLCGDLEVDYDNLPGESKAGKARELVAYMQRRTRLPELVAAIRRERPDIQL